MRLYHQFAEEWHQRLSCPRQSLRRWCSRRTGIYVSLCLGCYRSPDICKIHNSLLPPY